MNRGSVLGSVLMKALLLGSCATVALVALTGCSAVYPEMQTAVREPAPEAELTPEPAADLYYIYFESAIIPNHTQDGRDWGGKGPDPYAKMKLGKRDLITTPVERGTRKPTWPKQKRANYQIPAEADVFVEIWDARAMSDYPICQARVMDIQQIRDGGNNAIQCNSGARLFIHIEKARPMMGLGLFYELRGSDGVRVTRVVARSPSERAGLSPGDRILAIQGTPVGELDALAVRGKINANSRTGVKLKIKAGKDGAVREVELAEGAIYPLAGDGIDLPQSE